MTLNTTPRTKEGTYSRHTLYLVCGVLWLYLSCCGRFFTLISYSDMDRDLRRWWDSASHTDGGVIRHKTKHTCTGMYVFYVCTSKACANSRFSCSFFSLAFASFSSFSLALDTYSNTTVVAHTIYVQQTNGAERQHADRHQAFEGQLFNRKGGVLMRLRVAPETACVCRTAHTTKRF